MTVYVTRRSCGQGSVGWWKEKSWLCHEKLHHCCPPSADVVQPWPHQAGEDTIAWTVGSSWVFGCAPTALLALLLGLRAMATAAQALFVLRPLQSFQNTGFRAEGCVSPAPASLSREGEGSVTEPEHITSVLQEEVSLSAVAESCPRISLVKQDVVFKQDAISSPSLVPVSFPPPCRAHQPWCLLAQGLLCCCEKSSRKKVCVIW